MSEFSSSISIGSMGALQYLYLNHNQVGDSGMVTFSEALGSGSLRALEDLNLCYNQIGDAGTVEFSRSITIGSLPACKMIIVEDENPGNAAPLKAACEKRGIACM